MDRSGRVDFAGKARKKDIVGTTALQSIPNTLSFPTSCPPLQIISTLTGPRSGEMLSCEFWAARPLTRPKLTTVSRPFTLKAFDLRNIAGFRNRHPLFKS
jgi:hypothetical protein